MVMKKKKLKKKNKYLLDLVKGLQKDLKQRDREDVEKKRFLSEAGQRALAHMRYMEKKRRQYFLEGVFGE